MVAIAWDGHFEGSKGEGVEQKAHVLGDWSAEICRNGMQGVLTVEGLIKRRIEDVKARNPAEGKACKPPRTLVHGPGIRHTDVAPEGRQGKAETHPKMSRPGEAFHKRVDDKNEKGKGGELDAKRAEEPRGIEIDGAANHRDAVALDRRQFAAGELASRRARIFPIDSMVNQAVQGQGASPRT